MEPQNSRQRIMDSAAVGPQQFTVSQRTYIDSMPHVGRSDPLPTDFHMSKTTHTSDGTMFYSDLWPDDEDGWADPGGSFGSLFAVTRP